jgi:hypothetical protein
VEGLSLLGSGVQMPFHDSTHNDASAIEEISVLLFSMPVMGDCNACGLGACASHHFVGMGFQFMPMKAAWRKTHPR